MQVEQELAELYPEKDMLITIGVFDGVHLGHKHLISKLMERARQQGLLSGVVTFRQHPQEILSPRSKLLFLTDLATRVNLLKNEGVDTVIALSFTHELAQLSARQFVSLLSKYLRIRGLVIGPDFALGLNKEGNADTLRALGKDMGFSVSVVPPKMVNGEVASSTIIRRALADGNMKKAAGFMGRAFSLHGHVVTGTGRGTELGFPTANLDVDSKQALPAEGVYATWACIDDKSYQSMTNIGRRPTFGGSERTVEVYIPNYHGDLYGRELKIDIIKRLREEKKFDTADELKRQIAEDIKQGSSILTSRARD